MDMPAKVTLLEGKVERAEKSQLVRQSTSVSTGSKKKKKKRVLAFNCDACGKTPLVGARFHCTICENFDLCSECFTAPIAKHEPSHLYCLKRIPIEEDSLKKRPRADISRSSSEPIEKGMSLSDSITSDTSNKLIDKVNAILEMNNIVKILPSKLSVKSAADFDQLFATGWKACLETDATLVQPGIVSQLVCLNSLILAQLPLGKLKMAVSTLETTTTTVCTVLLAFVAQLLERTESMGIWSTPFHPDLKSPIPESMKLSYVYDKVFESLNNPVAHPGVLYLELSKDIFMVWNNMMERSPRESTLHRTALLLGRQCSVALRQSAVLFGLEIQMDDFDFEKTREMKVLNHVPVPALKPVPIPTVEKFDENVQLRLVWQVNTLASNVERLSKRLNALITFVERSFGQAHQQIGQLKKDL